MRNQSGSDERPCWIKIKKFSCLGFYSNQHAKCIAKADCHTSPSPSAGGGGGGWNGWALFTQPMTLLGGSRFSLQIQCKQNVKLSE